MLYFGSESCSECCILITFDLYFILLFAFFAFLLWLSTIDRSQFCRLHGAGRYQNLEYMVMTKLGRTVSSLKKSQPTGNLSVSTTIRIGYQVVKGLSVLHRKGFVHRDIKPVSFYFWPQPKYYYINTVMLYIRFEAPCCLLISSCIFGVCLCRSQPVIIIISMSLRPCIHRS